MRLSKAQKEYECDTCGGPIKIGEIYAYADWFTGRDVEVSHVHVACVLNEEGVDEHIFSPGMERVFGWIGEHADKITHEAEGYRTRLGGGMTRYDARHNVYVRHNNIVAEFGWDTAEPHRDAKIRALRFCQKAFQPSEMPVAWRRYLSLLNEEANQ